MRSWFERSNENDSANGVYSIVSGKNTIRKEGKQSERNEERRIREEDWSSEMMKRESSH